MMINLNRLTHHGFTRAVSMLLALSLSVVVLLMPQLLVNANGTTSHGWLSLLMVGMSLCFIHGVGFIPVARILVILFSPITAWGCILISGYFIWS